MITKGLVPMGGKKPHKRRTRSIRQVMHYEEGPGQTAEGGEWVSDPFPGPPQTLAEIKLTGEVTPGATYWGPNLRRCTCGHSRREHFSKTYQVPDIGKGNIYRGEKTVRYRGACWGKAADDTRGQNEGEACWCEWFVEAWDQRRTLPKPPKPEPVRKRAPRKERVRKDAPPEKKPSWYKGITW